MRLVKRTVLHEDQNKMKWCGRRRARLSFDDLVEQDATTAAA